MSLYIHALCNVCILHFTTHMKVDSTCSKKSHHYGINVFVFYNKTIYSIMTKKKEV